jgi:hypothetical protein
MANGARAVGDGQCGGLSNGVGNAVEGDLSRGRAVGGIGSEDLGDVVNSDRAGAGVGGHCGNGGCESGNSGDGCELHLDGCVDIIYFKSKGGLSC